MTPARRVEVEAVFEALRAGRVPAHGLELLATGVDDVLVELDRAVAQVGQGYGSVRFVRGGYGSGKTFVTRYAQARARAAGYATAHVVVSEAELRLWRADELYAAVCAGLGTREVPNGALNDLVQRWVGRIETRLVASGLDEHDPRFAGEVSAAIVRDLMAHAGRAMPLAMATAVRGLHDARQRGDMTAYHGLLQWVMGGRNVSSAVLRKVGLKGTISDAEGMTFLRGLVSVVQLAGYRGLVVVIDELETVLRAPRASRSRSLNAMRQLVDAADELPGVLWLVTGTPELFDSRAGVAGLAPLHDRIRYLQDGGFASLRQPQLSLPPFDAERLLEVGRRVAGLARALWDDIDPGEVGAALAAAADDAWLVPLIDALTTGFDGRVDVVPRRFLREVVHRLDLLATNPAYDVMATLDGVCGARPDAAERDALAAPAEESAPYVVEDVW